MDNKPSRIPGRKVAGSGSGLDKCDILYRPKAEMQLSEDAQHYGKASCLASSQRDTQTAPPSRLFSTDNRSTDEGKDEYLLKLLNRGKPKALHHPLPSNNKGFLEPPRPGSGSARDHSTAMITDSTTNPQANLSGSARTAKFPAYNSTFNTTALAILTEKEEAAAAAVLEKEEGQSPQNRGIHPAAKEEQQGSRPSRPPPTNESPRTRGEEAAAAVNDADDESKEQQKKKRKKTHQPATKKNMFSPVPLPNVAVHGIGAELSFNTTKLRLGKDNAEALRTTVLQHQVTFLDQLYDLHRSIAIQRLLVKSCPEVEGVMSGAVKLLQSGGASWAGGSGGRNNDNSGFLRPAPRRNRAAGGNGETTKRTSSDDLRPDSQFAAVPQVIPGETATEEADNDDSGKDGNEGGSGSGGGSNSPQPLAQQQHYQPHMYVNALQQQLAFPFGALHHPALNLAGPAPSGASAAPSHAMMMYHHQHPAAHHFMQAAPQPILPPHMMMMMMSNGGYTPQNNSNNNMGLMWPPTNVDGGGGFVHAAAPPLDPMAWWYQTYYGGGGNGNATGALMQQQQQQQGGGGIAQPANTMMVDAGNTPVVVNIPNVNNNNNNNNNTDGNGNPAGNAPPNNNNNNNLGGIPPTRWWLDPQQTFGPPVDADLLAKLHSQQVAQRIAGEAESAPPGAPACLPPSLFMTAANTLNNNKDLGKLEQQQQMLRQQQQQQQQSFPSGTMTGVGMAGARPMVMMGEDKQQQPHVDGLQRNTGATPLPSSFKKVSLFSRTANGAGVVVHGEAGGGGSGGGRIATTTTALRKVRQRKRKLDDDYDEASSGTTTPAGDHGGTAIYSDLHARLTAVGNGIGIGIGGSDLVGLDKNAANLLLSMGGKITTNTGTGPSG